MIVCGDPESLLAAWQAAAGSEPLLQEVRALLDARGAALAAGDFARLRAGRWIWIATAALACAELRALVDHALRRRDALRQHLDRQVGVLPSPVQLARVVHEDRGLARGRRGNRCRSTLLEDDHSTSTSTPSRSMASTPSWIDRKSVV